MRHRCRRAACGLTLLLLASAVFADGQTRVSIQAKDRGLREVIEVLAKAAGVKVQIRPEVRGVVSTTITRTPFEEALTVVTATHGYGWRYEKGVYHVGRFSDAADGGETITRRVAVAGFDVRQLARSFGWLELASLGDPAPVLELTAFLPPGLKDAPRPVGEALEVTGSPRAVADFEFLVRQLQEGRSLLSYRIIVARATAAAINDLPVYWAKGEMRHGTSAGREVRYSAGAFERVARLLTEPREGLERLLDETVATTNLATVTVGSAETATVALAGRVEASLGLRLWLQATVKVDEQEIPLTLEGAPLPPEEGALLVARPADGGDGPQVLALVIPTVRVLGEQ